MTTIEAEPTTEFFKVGETVKVGALASMPDTTRVRFAPDGNQYVLTNGYWVNPRMEARYHLGNMTGEYVIEFLPFEVPKSTPDQGWDTFTTRFRDSVEQGAADYGVRRATVDPAYERIGFTLADPISVYPGMPVWSRWLMNQAPVGTIIAHDAMSLVTVREQGGWVRVVPQRAVGIDPEPGGTLVRWGTDGPTELTYLPPVLDTAEAVRTRMGKRQAWTVSMALKRSHSWCGTLESLVRRGGVSEADADEDSLGYPMQRQLPVGTWLMWVHAEDPQYWSVLVRDDTSTTAGRTRRLFGTDTTERNGRPTVSVVLPDAIPLRARDLLAALPDRSQVIYDRSSHYIKAGDEWVYVSRDTGDWSQPFTRNLDRFQTRHASNRFGSSRNAVNVTYIPGGNA